MLPTRILFLATACACASASLFPNDSARTRERIDDGWRFALGHATDRAADFGFNTGYFSYLAKTGFGDGPAAAQFDDRWWREVDLPHDWAVEMDFDPAASFSHGFKKVGPGFPENSIGWYRHSVFVPESDLGKRIRIEFDAIYRDAMVFVNGFFVGCEASGFLSQSYDVSEYLNYGGENVIAVRADASTEEGWYYEGAGIYQSAYLLKTDPLHVARPGTWVRSHVEAETAVVAIDTEIVNEGRETRAFRLEQSVFDPAGELVAESNTGERELAAGASFTEAQTLTVPDPQLWDLDTPHLYRLITELVADDGTVLDHYETSFGIREIRFDPDHGFFLNGRSVKLKGTNNHHDHAGVGAATPEALIEFRLRKLKEMGSNAYRVAHHPATPALLRACDKLGMLVIDENRLMGINEYHLGQLEEMIRRDRNHPSVIMWSIGNEEWAIEGNILGARITTRMQDFVHRLDPTRPVTAAISGGWGGISTTVQVMGVNYIKHGDTDQQHRDFPEQIIVGTEETTTQATRGIYFENAALAHQPPRENGSSGGNAELGWQHYAARDYAAGIFYWTGFDYRGEPTPYVWPAVLSQFGILDNCGFPKDSFYYLKSWWSDEPVLHVFPHWNWSGREGEPIEVRVHSNCDSVELFVNDTSLGEQSMPENGSLRWTVPYAPGELRARGTRANGETMETVVRTTGPAAAVELVADRNRLEADGRDLAVVTVQILDERGDVVPTENEQVHFSVEGPGKIIGVGNGNPSSLEPDQYLPSVAHQTLGSWTAPSPAITDQPVVYEIRFDRPTLGPDQTARLLLNPIGLNQSATLNGKVLYEGADPQRAKTTYALDTLDLRATGNVLRLEAQPYGDWGARERVASILPASLALRTPAAPWQRTTFNGLAQVIVQTTGEPGAIVLQADVEGLRGASVELEAAAPAP